MENRISATITTADQNEILLNIKTVGDGMPWLVTLDADEVLRELKLDKDSVTYLDETLAILGLVPEPLISTEKETEFQKDLNFYRAMIPVALAVIELENKIRKTMIRSGQEMTNVFREVYKLLQVKAQHDSTYQVYLDRLTPYFKKFGRKNDSPES